MAGTVSSRPVFACATCGGALETEGAAGFVCSACGRRAPVVDGVVVFAETDAFYDDYAGEHAQFHPDPGRKEVVLRWLPFWSWREWRFLRAHVPDDGVLVELGCGRGRELFAKRTGPTIGLEGSMASARDCARVYDAVALAQLPGIPLPDRSADAVVSAHVIGHLAAGEKDTLLAEIRRVLRPGGITVHIIETDSAHPAVAAAKQHPGAYDQQFVQQHGHIGLEFTDVVVDRFSRAGFDVQRVELVEAIVPSVQNLRTFFAHPELERLPELRTSRRLERVASASGATNLVYEVAMGGFHRTIEQWAGKRDRAQFIHLVARARG